MRVYPLLVGDFAVNGRVLFRNGNPVDSVQFSSYAFYVEDGDTRMIVDTGFGDVPSCIRHLGREVHTPPGMSLEEQLGRRGVALNDISTVIVTHCHWDHIGGLGLFKKAKIYCQGSEIPWVLSPPIWLTESYSPHFSHLVIEARDRLVLVEGDHALTNRISMIKVGGHSPGSQVVELKGETADVIIAGDAVFYFANLERDIPNGESMSLSETVDTLRTFRNRIIERPMTKVLPGHDPKLWTMHGQGIQV